MRQSMSIYQRFSGGKCKQFSWIGFPSKPEPQEAVKIELGRVGEGGGRRVEAYTCPIPDSSLLWSLEHGGIDFKVGVSVQCIDYVLKFHSSVPLMRLEN